MRGLLRVAIVLGLLSAAQRAEAIPLLQLDLEGGVYDPISQTIKVNNGPFTLYAILTPQVNPLSSLLAQTYYISVALSPQTAPPGSDLGAFEFGSSTVSVTSGMTYGDPPIERILGGAGWDPGDLAKHSVYPTYFKEFAFTFSAANQTGIYDTAINPGGPIPGSGAYYASFTGDSSGLADGYSLHFDLYSELLCIRLKSTCNSLGDIDISQFAPFSHDAETTVPEPASMSLLGAGLFGLAAAGRLRRKVR